MLDSYLTWAIGAVVAQVPYKHKVTSSNLVSPTRAKWQVNHGIWLACFVLERQKHSKIVLLARALARDLRENSPKPISKLGDALFLGFRESAQVDAKFRASKPKFRASKRVGHAFWEVM